MSMTILILDADNASGHALAAELVEAGHAVIAHSRTPWSGTSSPGVRRILTADPAQLMAQLVADTPFDSVVFNLRNADETHASVADEAHHFADVIGNDLVGFLTELQAAANALIRRDGGQIWVLTQDDGMDGDMQMESAPVRATARIAAAKCLAKEIARFGVILNAVCMQTLAEQDPIYENRHRPVSAATTSRRISVRQVAAFLRRLLEMDRLPMAGVCMPVGFGVATCAV